MNKLSGISGITNFQDFLFACELLKVKRWSGGGELDEETFLNITRVQKEISIIRFGDCIIWSEDEEDYPTIKELKIKELLK